MLVATPQITWHGGENGKNDPLLSADVHLSCGVLVTGGADADVRVSACTVRPLGTSPSLIVCDSIIIIIIILILMAIIIIVIRCGVCVSTTMGKRRTSKSSSTALKVI